MALLIWEGTLESVLFYRINSSYRSRFPSRAGTFLSLLLS
jgi:hypothetical protein